MEFRLDLACQFVINFTSMKTRELGNFITKRRKALRVNQKELASLCGVSEHALCNLERGVGNPTLNLINSVADALGLELRLGVRDVEAT